MNTNIYAQDRSHSASRSQEIDDFDDLRYQEAMDREAQQRRRPFNYTANIEHILREFI